MTTVHCPPGESADLGVDDDVLFRTMFDSSGLGMASLGPDLSVRDANGEFVRAFDRPSDKVIGRNFFEFLHPGSHPVVRRHFEKLTDGRRRSFTDRMVAVRPCAATFTGEMTGIAVPQGAERTAAVMIIVRPEKAGGPQSTVDRERLLSDLDARILEGIATGMSTVQLASRLYLSRQGVEYHVSTMLRRLKAPNRAALVSRAYASGVLALGAWPPRVLPEAIK